MLTKATFICWNKNEHNEKLLQFNVYLLNWSTVVNILSESKKLIKVVLRLEHI